MKQDRQAPPTREPALARMVQRMVQRMGLLLACASPLAPALIVADVLADVGLMGTAPSEPERNAAIERSRALADAFMKELKGALGAAIEAQGVAGAVAVCSEKAPAIAARLSAESGARVMRKAERNRNPAAALDALEAAEWPTFAAAPMQAPGKPREKLVVHQEDGATHLRYLRSIPTAGMCLACHGDAPAEDVRAVLTEYYPGDLTTGFAEGDLRGLISIDWSLQSLRAAMVTPASPADRIP